MQNIILFSNAMFYVDKDQKEFAMVIDDSCKSGKPGGAPARFKKASTKSPVATKGSTKSVKAPTKSTKGSTKGPTKESAKAANRLFDLRMPGDTHGDEKKEKDKVTRSDLAFMESNQPFILLVHANWCGHCTNMKKDWKDAAKGTKLPVVNVENDLQVHMVQHHPSELLSQLLRDVSGFPSIYKVQSGKKVPFEGPRSLESFKALMRKDL